MRVPSKTELMFRTIHTVIQLSIFGAVASWCDDLPQRILGQNELIMEKSRGERTPIRKCEAARSEFFGTNSKEQRWGIWKHIARTTSET